MTLLARQELERLVSNDPRLTSYCFMQSAWRQNEGNAALARLASSIQTNTNLQRLDLRLTADSSSELVAKLGRAVSQSCVEELRVECRPHEEAPVNTFLAEAAASRRIQKLTISFPAPLLEEDEEASISFQGFLDFISKAVGLKELKLSGRLNSTLAAPTTLALAQAFQQAKQLQHLDITFMDFDAGNANSILAAFFRAAHSQLRAITVNTLRGEQAIGALARLLQRSTDLQELKLGSVTGCNRELIRGLQQQCHKTLERLDISCLNLGLEDARGYVETIQMSGMLSSLRLTLISPSFDPSILLEAVHDHVSLQSLDFAIRSAAPSPEQDRNIAMALRQLLERNDRLECLCLRHLALSLPVVKGLIANSSLKRVEFHHCRNELAACVEACARPGTRVKAIKCHMDEDNDLMLPVRVYHQLGYGHCEEVELYEVHVGDNHISHLAETLRLPTSRLRKLSLNHLIDVQDEDAVALLNALGTNRSLQVFSWREPFDIVGQVPSFDFRPVLGNNLQLLAEKLPLMNMHRIECALPALEQDHYNALISGLQSNARLVKLQISVRTSHVVSSESWDREMALIGYRNRVNLLKRAVQSDASYRSQLLSTLSEPEWQDERYPVLRKSLVSLL